MSEPVDKMNHLIATDPKHALATELETLKRAARACIDSWTKHENLLNRQGPISMNAVSEAYREKVAAFEKLKELVK